MKNLFRKSSCVAVSLLLLCSMTLSVLAAEYYIDDGSIQITDTHVNQEGKEAAAHDGNVTVTQRDPSTATSNTVTVKTESTNVTVTLKDVNIDSASGAAGIGGGHSGEGNNITITDGEVKKVLFAFGEDWEETLEDGVLTITAPADAELKINVYAMNVLLGRNIDQIVFGGRTLALRDLVKGQTAKTEYIVSAGKLTLDGKEV